MILASLRATIKVVPQVLPHLSLSTRRELAEPMPYKTYEFFLSAVEGLVEGVYNGLVDSDFVYAMDNLITGQLRDAYIRAWADDGNTGEIPEYLQTALDDMVEEQQSHVVDFWHDIIDARVDKTPIAPLLNRAAMWANQWETAYNDAVRLIAVENGGKLLWEYGNTEHCSTCLALNGVVAYAREWDELGVHPRGGPNPLLECNGFHCDCSLKPTDRRRSPNAYTTIMNAVNK